MEDARAVNLARSSTEGRKMMKHFKQRHGAELNRGEDPRSSEHMIKMKGKRLMDKMKRGGSEAGGGSKSGEK